jgi:hypothetical protein
MSPYIQKVDNGYVVEFVGSGLYLNSESLLVKRQEAFCFNDFSSARKAAVIFEPDSKKENKDGNARQ